MTSTKNNNKRTLKQTKMFPVRAKHSEEKPVSTGTIQDMLEQSAIKNNKLKTYTVHVEPELAEVLLGNNEGNRPLKKRTLETYARDMEAGDFALTGETIILSDKWKLLNGQHRLNACILAKAGFDAVIIQGVPDSVYHKLDSGEIRRLADALAHAGESNAKVLGAAFRVVWQWENQALFSSKRSASRDEIFHVRNEHPGLRQFNTSTFAKSVKGMPGSIVTAFRYIFGKYSDHAAAEFFEKLKTGEGLKRGDPILLLRDKLADKEKGRTQGVIGAVTIKAWNAWLAGEAITAHNLRFRTGKGGEDFPKILGVDVPFDAKTIGAK